MARTETQTRYEIELEEVELEMLANGGKAIPVNLPDGNSLEIVPPGGDINTRVDNTQTTTTREGVEAGTDEDADPEEIEQLVQESQQEATPAPNGGDTEEDEGNPRGGGMIDIERAGE